MDADAVVGCVDRTDLGVQEGLPADWPVNALGTRGLEQRAGTPFSSSSSRIWESVSSGVTWS